MLDSKTSTISKIQYVLLHSYLSFPNFPIVLRTCPPSLISEAISAFDQLTYVSVPNLVGDPLTNWSKKKASLPVSYAGLGIYLAIHHALAAYIDSWCQSSALVSDSLGYAQLKPVYLDFALGCFVKNANRPD